MATILTHNYPGTKPFAGIFIKNMLELIGGEHRIIGHEGFSYNPFKLFWYLVKTFSTVVASRGPILAFWIYPAGVLAWLCRRRYSLVCVGIDIFSICKSPLYMRLARPVLDRAVSLVFIGEYPMTVFMQAYGDRYKEKSSLIHLPVDQAYISRAHARLASVNNR
jgi:hypothetical protein